MKTAVRDVMTTRVIWVRKDAPFRELAAALRRVKRLPVTDANGRLVGIISRADVLSVFDRTDSEIRDEIGELIRSDFLVDPHAFDVTVKDGVVTLAGVPETNEIGHELAQRVRHVQGVVAVRDRLSYLSA
jgi:signal-transduction protein with cAMP-binding, CBS, and nucleotidyltransferase domain